MTFVLVEALDTKRLKEELGVTKSDDRKSIALLEAWFTQIDYPHAQRDIALLRRVRQLRNAASHRGGNSPAQRALRPLQPPASSSRDPRRSDGHVPRPGEHDLTYCTSRFPAELGVARSNRGPEAKTSSATWSPIRWGSEGVERRAGLVIAPEDATVTAAMIRKAALDTAALAQIARPDSEDRRLYDSHLARGKTKREALRCLKRRISDRVWIHLQHDAKTPTPTPQLT